MHGWYHRLLTGFGLDSIREDRLFQALGRDLVSDATPLGFWARILRVFRPARVLVAMDPLPDRLLESTVGWALVVGNDSRPRLQFTIRAPRRLFRRNLNGSPDIAVSLLEIAKAAGEHECGWSDPRE